MGMFDEVIIKYPLPGKPPTFIEEGHRFQTKDFDSLLETYVINKDGRLFRIDKDEVESFCNRSEDIHVYSSNICGSGSALYTQNGEDAESVEYLAMIKNGQLLSITEIERTIEPAFPISKMDISFKIPNKEEIEAYKLRSEEKLTGKKVYVLWGGQADGYFGEVVADGIKDICIKKNNGELELLFRGNRDHIFWDSKKEAISNRDRKDSEFAAKKKEYDDYVESRKHKK